MNWNDVVEIGLKLPGVEASTWYGRPALKVGGKGFAAWRKADRAELEELVEDGWLSRGGRPVD